MRQQRRDLLAAAIALVTLTLAIGAAVIGRIDPGIDLQVEGDHLVVAHVTPYSPATNDQVKVGIIPIVDVAPIYLGQKQGFFANRKIELTMESGQGGAAIVPGVVSGQFQFGFSNMTSLLIAETKDVPIKVVANGVASTGEAGKDFGGVVVKKDSPITR